MKSHNDNVNFTKKAEERLSSIHRTNLKIPTGLSVDDSFKQNLTKVYGKSKIGEFPEYSSRPFWSPQSRVFEGKFKALIDNSLPDFELMDKCFDENSNHLVTSIIFKSNEGMAKGIISNYFRTKKRFIVKKNIFSLSEIEFASRDINLPRFIVLDGIKCEITSKSHANTLAILYGETVKGNVHYRPLYTVRDIELAIYDMLNVSIFKRAAIQIPNDTPSPFIRDISFYYRYKYSHQGPAKWTKLRLKECYKSFIYGRDRDQSQVNILNLIPNLCSELFEESDFSSFSSEIPTKLSEMANNILQIIRSNESSDEILSELILDFERVYEEIEMSNSSTRIIYRPNYKLISINRAKFVKTNYKYRKNAITSINKMELRKIISRYEFGNLCQNKEFYESNLKDKYSLTDVNKNQNTDQPSQEISNINSIFEYSDQDINFEFATQIFPDVSLNESHFESKKYKNLPQKCKLYLEKLSLLEIFKLKLKCKELFGPDFQENLSQNQFTKLLKLSSSKFFTDDEIYYLFSSLKESFISNGDNKEFSVNINSFHGYIFEDDYKKICIDKYREKIQYDEKYKSMFDNFDNSHAISCDDNCDNESLKIKKPLNYPPVNLYKQENKKSPLIEKYKTSAAPRIKDHFNKWLNQINDIVTQNHDELASSSKDINSSKISSGLSIDELYELSSQISLEELFSHKGNWIIQAEKITRTSLPQFSFIKNNSVENVLLSEQSSRDVLEFILRLLDQNVALLVREKLLEEYRNNNKCIQEKTINSDSENDYKPQNDFSSKSLLVEVIIPKDKINKSNTPLSSNELILNLPTSNDPTTKSKSKSKPETTQKFQPPVKNENNLIPFKSGPRKMLISPPPPFELLPSQPRVVPDPETWVKRLSMIYPKYRPNDIEDIDSILTNIKFENTPELFHRRSCFKRDSKRSELKINKIDLNQSEDELNLNNNSEDFLPLSRSSSNSNYTDCIEEIVSPIDVQGGDLWGKELEPIEYRKTLRKIRVDKYSMPFNDSPGVKIEPPPPVYCTKASYRCAHEFIDGVFNSFFTKNNTCESISNKSLRLEIDDAEFSNDSLTQDSSIVDSHLNQYQIVTSNSLKSKNSLKIISKPIVLNKNNPDEHNYKEASEFLSSKTPDISKMSNCDAIHELNGSKSIKMGKKYKESSNTHDFSNQFDKIKVSNLSSIYLKVDVKNTNLHKFAQYNNFSQNIERVNDNVNILINENCKKIAKHLSPQPPSKYKNTNKSAYIGRKSRILLINCNNQELNNHSINS